MTEFWIVVTEFDMPPGDKFLDGAEPRGPLVHEGFIADEDQARARAASLNGKYGWAVAVKVQAELPERYALPVF